MLRRRVNRQIVDYQNDLILKHCDEVENMYRLVRGWRHDFHNHIQVIKAYIDLGQTEALAGYCQMLEADLAKVDQVLKTGNIMLDAILNSKLSLAKNHGIHVNCKAIVPKELGITDVDLCVLMGNLLDNAVEACLKEERKSAAPPFIRVYIGMKGRQLYICVTNTARGEVKKQGGHFLSTKNSPSHGFGLMRIDRICHQYGGYCNRNSEPGAFSTEILLPVG